MALASSPSPSPEEPSTPPAPRHGTWHDQWDPYQTRKSGRIASQRPKKSTPPPTISRKHRNAQMTAGMSPQKKRQPAAPSVRRGSTGCLTAESIAEAAARLGPKLERPPPFRPSDAPKATDVLLTPKSTPYKAPNTASEAKKLDNVSRNLFSDGSEGPRAKKPKKYSGLTMDSFRAEEDDIDIFTDSTERIPQKDYSPSNPFFGNQQPSNEPARRRSPRNVNVPGAGMIPVEEACKREDGMVYTFRGRRYFRSKNENSDVSMDNEAAADAEGQVRRSEFKPRRLFTSEKDQASFEEEEADTDIDDSVESQPSFGFSTPKKAKTDTDSTAATTPDMQRHMMSPPDTRSTTRFTNKKVAKPKGEQTRLVDYFSSRSSRSRSTGSPPKRLADEVPAERIKRARHN